MFRRLLFFFLISASLFSEEDSSKENPLCTKYGGVSSIVNGSVSAINGVYFENVPILSLQPYAELDFTQQYASANHGKKNFPHLEKCPYDTEGWSNNLASSVVCWNLWRQGNQDRIFGTHTDIGGFGVTYQGDYFTGILLFDPEDPSNQGYTNFGMGEIGGKNNPKNDKLYWTRKFKLPRKLVRGDGGTDIFNYAHAKVTERFRSSKKIKHRKVVYPLSEKRKPNGRVVHYDYDKKGYTVRVKNQTGDTEFGWIRYSMDPGSAKKRITTSDGREVVFLPTTHKKSKVDRRKVFHIEKIDNPYGISATYQYRYHKPSKRYLLHQKTLPNGFFIKNEYQGKRHQVAVQCSPVGPTLKSVKTHRFKYFKNNPEEHLIYTRYGLHRTDVYDAYDRKTSYHSDRFQRLTRVEKYLDDDTIYRIQQNNFNSAGELTGELLIEGEEWAHSGRHFEYDKQGNIIKDTLLGNLTGKGSKKMYNSWYSAGYLNRLETLSKTYTYTDDGFNLVKSETLGRVTKEYSYQPKTNLVTKVLVKADGEIVQREFNTYDKNASLIRKIIDDGSSEDADALTGVTQRKIERITPVASGPTVGLPEIAEEFYLENGEEKRLKKTVYSYTPEGWVKAKTVYNANDEHLFTIDKEYNLRGQPTSWNDAEGNLYTREYDEMGQVVYESTPTSAVSYTYDHAGRCIAKQHSDDHAPETFSYDYCGNVTSKTDIFGNETTYEYDHFYRPIREAHESTGKLIVKEYDINDNPIKITDGNGNTTKIAYTFYKKPSLIEYADGTKEQFTYNLEGKLIEKVHKSGLITRYELDPFHRVTKVVNISPEGEVLSEETTEYNAFNMISETNAEGVTTFFKYDGAGRLIEEKRGHPLKQYIYDPNGNLREKRVFTGKGAYYSELYTYNLLGKVIEKKVVSQNGELQRINRFAYDPLGNVLEKTSLVNGEESTVRLEYDGRSRLIKIISPIGLVTHYQYTSDQEFIEINPKGVQTVKKLNADGKEIEEKTLDPFGQEIRKVEKKYDLVGNPVQEVHTVFNGEEVLKTITNSWEMDSQYRVIAICEAEGTPEQKITRHSYNFSGEKIKTVKPDGTEIHYSYTPEGYLKSLKSPDLHYVYRYNRLGKPVRIEDKVQNTVTVREYDENQFLVGESLGNDLRVSSEKDPVGRTLLFNAPGKDPVRYTYDGINLETIQYGTDTHSYTYDTAGLITESMTPNNLVIRTDRDTMGRIVRQVSTPAGYEQLAYDENDNLIACTINGRQKTYTHNHLDQLLTENDTNYSYDSLSNRLSKDEEAYSYNSLNQYTHLEYDLNGNPSEMEGCSLEYDSLDRLVKLTKDDTTITYTYDSFHRRLTKTTNGKTIRYLYHNEEEIGSYDQAACCDYRVLGAGRGAEIGATVMIDLGKDRYFPVHDHQGNIAALTSRTKESTPLVIYSAYGEKDRSTPSPWTFMGKREEELTEWINFGKRYYLPQKGRFLTPDPIGFKDGPNLYAYCHSRPLHFVDHRGEKADSIAGSICSFFRFVVGELLQVIGNHCIPVSGVSNVVGGVGRYVENGEFTLEADWYHPSVVQIIGERKPYQSCGFIIMNGMNTKYEDFYKFSQGISKTLGGAEVVMNYVSTHGLSKDLGVVWLQKYDFDLKATRQTRSVMEDTCERYDRVVCIAHSRAAATHFHASKYLDDKIRDKLEVYNFGGAEIVPSNHYGYCLNIISTRDPVPFGANPILYLLAGGGEYFDAKYKGFNIKFLPGQGVFDHSINGDTYKTELDNILDEIKKREQL